LFLAGHWVIGMTSPSRQPHNAAGPLGRVVSTPFNYYVIEDRSRVATFELYKRF